jgi:hypothetical protein
MKKTVCGSFIICCDYNSYTFDLLNSVYPKYKDKSVCVIQCKVKRCKDKNTIVMYELIYV